MLNLKEVYQGWKNYLTNNKEARPIGAVRMKICSKCPLSVNGTCSKFKIGIVIKDFNYKGEFRAKGSVQKGCGCPLKMKVLSPDSQCPLGNF